MTKRTTWAKLIGYGNDPEQPLNLWPIEDLRLAFHGPFPDAAEATYEYGIALCDMVEEAMSKGVSREGLQECMDLWNGVNELESARLFFHVTHMHGPLYISRYEPTHDPIPYIHWPDAWPEKWR